MMHQPIKATFLAAILVLLCLSATELSAQETQAADESTPSSKPCSYAESIGTTTPVDIISEDVFVEPERHILISLADQRMWVFEGDAVIQRFPVSTGVPGHRTPTGSYQVRNQSTRAYSNRYECWMLHWQAFTADGLYGMHSLQGTSYLSRLGSVASHGCVRLSHEDAEWLYSWTEIGTPLEIVSDWEEPPPEKERPFRVGTGYCL